VPTLVQRLKRNYGVMTVDVDFESATAHIFYDCKRTNGEEILSLVEEAGFEATLISEPSPPPPESPPRWGGR